MSRISSLFCTFAFVIMIMLMPTSSNAAGKSGVPGNPNSDIENQTPSGLEQRVLNIDEDIRKMQERLTEQGMTRFAQLLIIGVGAFGIALTSAAFLGNLWIKDRVNALHEEEIKKTKSALADMLLTVNADIGANIYATIAGQCIDLYKNIPKPACGGVHHDLYNSYVNMAVTIATVGYRYSQKLQEQLDNQRDAQLTNKEKERYEKIKSVNLNNYLFYLAQRGRKGDREIVSELLPSLERIASDKQSESEKNWWYYKETVLWVYLHLKRATAKETREAVQLLINLDEVDYEWKKDTVAHYDLYNRLCSQASEKINLALPTPPS